MSCVKGSLVSLPERTVYAV